MFLVDLKPEKFLLCAFPQPGYSDRLANKTVELQKYLKHACEHFACDELKNWLNLATYMIPTVATASAFVKGFVQVWSWVSSKSQTPHERLV